LEEESEDEDFNGEEYWNIGDRWHEIYNLLEKILYNFDGFYDANRGYKSTTKPMTIKYVKHTRLELFSVM
jgi:hypothetical protein